MPRARRGWSRLSWYLILLVGLAAAVACASHPPGHDDGHGHDGGHPPLCTDTDRPFTFVQGKPSVFLDGGFLPLSPKSFISVVLLAVLSRLFLLGHQVLAEALSQRDTRTSISPPMFLVVLRQ